MVSDLPPVDPPKRPAPEGRARSPIWMRVLLVCSLAVNLAIAGIIAGAFYGNGPPASRAMADGSPRDAAREAFFGPLGDVLAKDDRRAIRREVIKNRRDLRDLRNALRGTYTDLLPLLRAETFDRPAFEAVLSTQRDAAGNIHKFAHNLVIDRLEVLTPEDRAAMADRLEGSIKRAGKRPRKDGRPPRDP